MQSSKTGLAKTKPAIRSNTLISLGRRELRTVVGILTGHCLFGEHAKRLGLETNDFCRGYEEEEETLVHFLCSCPALAHRRYKNLGMYFMNNLSDLMSCKVRNYLTLHQQLQLVRVRTKENDPMVSQWTETGLSVRKQPFKPNLTQAFTYKNFIQLLNGY